MSMGTTSQRECPQGKLSSTAPRSAGSIITWLPGKEGAEAQTDHLSGKPRSRYNGLNVDSGPAGCAVPRLFTCLWEDRLHT